MSVSQKINPWHNSSHQCLLSAWTHKASESIRLSLGGRRRDRDVVPLTLWPGWRHHQLTHRAARGRPSTSLMSRSRQWHRVRKMVSRGLMCHTQRDATKVSHHQSGNVSASGEHLQISRHAQKVEKGYCWCKACRKVGRICHTHTQQ